MNPRHIVFAAGALVALAAAAATAHGMYATAVASHIPPAMAVTYPVMADGLALVAYGATHWLPARSAGNRYAWVVVIAVALLSGLAQAVYLGSGANAAVDPRLAFWMGYWPAICGVVAVHLLYLLRRKPAVDPDPVTPTGVTPDPVDLPVTDPDSVTVTATVNAATRAAHAAEKHAAETGALPTLSQLETLAGVSRGTAANAMKRVKATTNGHPS